MAMIGLGAGILPLGATTANAGETDPGYGVYASAGPYQDEGTCNYWRHAVIASSKWASGCYYHQATCPGGCGSGWWFDY